MKRRHLYQFRVAVHRDPDTGQAVAEIPALDIADYGIDTQEALEHLKDMLAFHLECLKAEGKI